MDFLNSHWKEDARPSSSKQDLNMKRKTMSTLILNLSYDAIEKLVFPGRVITAAKRAICFQLWKSDGSRGSQCSPPTCNSAFSRKCQLLAILCHFTQKYILEEVSWFKKKKTLAVNQIIAKLLANSLQPFTVLNNKWIINFFIMALRPWTGSLCRWQRPRCVSSLTHRLGLLILHINQDANYGVS